MKTLFCCIAQGIKDSNETRRTFSRESNNCQGLTTPPNTRGVTQIHDSHINKTTITRTKRAIQKANSLGRVNSRSVIHSSALLHLSHHLLFILHFIYWHLASALGKKVLSNTILIKWAADVCAMSEHVQNHNKYYHSQIDGGY